MTMTEIGAAGIWKNYAGVKAFHGLPVMDHSRPIPIKRNTATTAEQVDASSEHSGLASADQV